MYCSIIWHKNLFHEIFFFLQDGKTSLMYSSEYGHVQCIKMLLDMSAKINHQDDVSAVSDQFLLACSLVV